jgi:phage-related tail protein
LGKIPIVGIAITAASIGVDIAEGKNPVQSVASGVSGLAAGAAVGTAIGGPVGVVVGAAVGAGVGYVVDEWGDDIAKGAGDGAKAVGGAIADGAKAVGKFVDDLF